MQSEELDVARGVDGAVCEWVARSAVAARDSELGKDERAILCEVFDREFGDAEHACRGDPAHGP